MELVIRRKRVNMNKIGESGNRTGMNNRGTTMIEILVAFTVLTLIMGVLYGIIAFSSELRMRSVDASNVLQEFNREIYNENSASGVIDQKEYHTQGNKALFYITPRDSQESSVNIPLTNLECTSYTYHVSGEEKDRMEHVVIPKVLVFSHKAD